MRVKITFSKNDNLELDLIYCPFDNEHSRLWLSGIINFINKGYILDDTTRVYNFNDYDTEIQLLLDKCNTTIVQLNQTYSLFIPLIRLDHLQDDVNYVHTYFVDSDRQNDTNPLWIKLNDYLHGLEIIERRGREKFQGQVFCTLPDSIKFPIPDESYSHFTTKKRFGYCYANYPHVGRHILEMYNARDEDAHDDHVLPMHNIAGDFYLWFGNDTTESYDQYRMNEIERWFKEKQINSIVGMNWGDPKLAIGWLPVAEIDHSVTVQDLLGLSQIKKIEIIN